MPPVLSSLFLIEPGSWLGNQLDCGKLESVSLKVALAHECRPNKGESYRDAVRIALNRETMTIEELTEDGHALRLDRIEALRAQSCGEDTQPSVDVCIRMRDNLMLVECKYKAMPETSIVKSIAAFNHSVVRKFSASHSFLAHEGACRFHDDKIVLFNADSKEKVLSMFLRVCLEDAGKALREYRIMDTVEFWSTYHPDFTF